MNQMNTTKRWKIEKLRTKWQKT